MSKIAIISDLHFGKRDSDFLDKQISFFENIFFPYLLENNIKQVFQLGDIFDQRKYSNNTMLSIVGEKFFRFFNKNKITLYIVVGNHDCSLRDSAKYSPLYQYTSNYVKPIKNNKVIDIDGTSFALHSYFCKDFLEADVGFFHHDFNSFHMNKNSLCENGIDFPNIKYKKVYSGHYHSSADKMYLHTPYQLSFESFGDKNGFLVFDTETYDETFVENTLNQRFVKVYYYDKNNIVVKDGSDEIVTNHENLKDVLKDNIVEFNIENIDDKMLIDKLLESLKYLEYKYNNYFLKTENIENKETIISDDFNNIEEMYNGYIETIKIDLPSLNEDMLKNDFLEIYRECLISEDEE